jgi:hypothetical protein
MVLGVIGCGSRRCKTCPYPFGSDICEEQYEELIQGELDDDTYKEYYL